MIKKDTEKRLEIDQLYEQIQQLKYENRTIKENEQEQQFFIRTCEEQLKLCNDGILRTADKIRETAEENCNKELTQAATKCKNEIQKIQSQFDKNVKNLQGTLWDCTNQLNQQIIPYRKENENLKKQIIQE
jgi:hypothetical protein